MNTAEDASRIRRQALDQIDGRQRLVGKIILAAGAVEGVALVGYLLLMDFSNRLHWLILIAAGLVYLTLSLGLLALGAALRDHTRRVVQAVAEIAPYKTESESQ